jgi:cytochrome b561
MASRLHVNDPLDPKRYTATAVLLHWLLALFIFSNFALGLYMSDLPVSPQRLKLYNYHKWVGITILGLAALRLLWRLTHTPPPLPSGTPAWQHRAAHLTHWALYALFFAVPFSGWAYSSATGFPIVYLGMLQLPDFVPKDRALADTLKLVHKIFSFSLGALVVLHIAAAFQHHFVHRDGLLSRMLPGSKG